MKYILKPLQWIYCIYALLLFIITMIVALPFVIVGSFFGKVKGGNFIYQVCKVWGLTWYFFVGIRHKNIYEVPHNTEGTYIFVANHSSYMDIPPIVIAMDQPVRVLGKYEMVKYPLFGSIYKRAVILVERKNAERRAKSVRLLKTALRKHISIFIFPEGTFNETEQPLKEFFDGAFRIAIETQTPIKPVLFVDALDRLHYSSIFMLTPGQCRVVFLEEIPVAGLHMKDVAALKQLVHRKMEEGLRRYRSYPAATAANESSNDA
ncbi:lysophospholipid acyltransferase family protein [Aridibaculum aurantiacum]|uniref:lysophospholipid acyltransferase family protein n=1 Tax=Aridibaculum aurantiacum TaxID=2810307 RepID=UPI001A95BF17|nr:lysophospholipid acyltransferase family protein [Aridibaculum aurantiacum]